MITVLKLAGATLLPVLLAAGLYLLERTRFGKWNYYLKQTVVGVLFGGVAVLATEFGIPVEGATLNVRNAAPLAAGLIFGGPSGIIAGVIGGVYRWIATYWGAGEFSKIACSLACVLAGLFGAGCRKFMFGNKKPSPVYGLALGVTTEVLHMLLLFVLNMNNVYSAYKIVAVCAVPMIVCCGLSVMLSLIAVSLIGKEKTVEKSHTRKIAQVFQFLLLICVVVAFGVTSWFTASLQTRISYANADSLLSLNIADVRNDVNEVSDERLLTVTHDLSGKASAAADDEALRAIAQEHNVAEINLIGADGIIYASTEDRYVGYDMRSGEQSAEFLCLLSGQDSYVQSYRPISADGNVSRKYAGVALTGGGFVQVGYNAEQFQSSLSEQIRLTVKNRHIGKEGGIIVCDENLVIISDNGDHDGELLVDKSDIDITSLQEGVRFTATVFGTESYCTYATSEGFYIIAVLPVNEAMFPRNIAVTVLMFMEILVFAALFIHVYFLIKRLIVDNIHKINSSLARITDGDLNVQVNVRANEEFASLSDDINATVETLKHYISEAESRIDRELEFARQIQLSSLPSVFPPYPDRKELDIYASMDAAKEVGGDFYDFYFIDNDNLIFLVADVSGKSIPGAMFMMRAKTLIKNLAESGRSIDEVFTQANRALCENNQADMFVTAWMGMLDLRSGVLSYVNAGHNPPLIRRADGACEFLRTRPNFILAGMDGTRYKKHEIQLLPGDEILLYTDGVTEATDKDGGLYGEERLNKAVCESLREPQNLCRAIRADIDKFVGEAEQFDDITMLCVRLNYIQSDSRIILTPDSQSVPAAMAFVRKKISEQGIGEKSANRLQIAVDEILTNIVSYSGASRAEISVATDGQSITLTFGDDGTPYDPTKAEEPDVTLSAEERNIGGLGIFMVKKMASSVEYGYVDGKNRLTVTFKLNA
ncbi:MAG: SpoIIE family protein phosphatase [Candidatus Coproplasma sp.]